jgi:DNA-binding MarR family transcriptional regulator
MLSINDSLKFLLNLLKVQTVQSRRFERQLGGLGTSEFIILFHLSQAPHETLMRMDLAEIVGLTPSGITRLLLPMEKIGLIKKVANERDARSSLVVLAPGGKTKLTEAIERAEHFCDELLRSQSKAELKGFSKLLIDLGGSIK